MIVTLCGSSRFESWWHLWMKALTLAGHSVFGLGSYPSFNKGEKSWYSEDEKKLLDQVHFNKIAASDAAVFLNVFGYLGESSLRELGRAKELDKKIFFLESWGKGCGVGPSIGMYTSEARRLFEELGIPKDYTSPIDTHGSGMLPWDLFGSAGPTRSELSRMIDEHGVRRLTHAGRPKLVYLAHPVSGDVEANLDSARLWIDWAYHSHENIGVVADWILMCEAVDDAEPKWRKQGLDFDRKLVARCDELWLVGGRVSQGMVVEREAAIEAGVKVVDLTHLGATPPACP